MRRLSVFLLSLIFFSSSFIVNANDEADTSSIIAKITFSNDTSVCDPRFKQLTFEKIEALRSLSEVKHIEHLISVNLFSNTLKLPVTINQDEYKAMHGLTEITTTGISIPEFIYLNENVIELKRGRTFFNNELASNSFERVPVILSSELADLNQLDVGSTFKLSNSVYFITLDYKNLNSPNIYKNNNIVDEIEYEFEVIGVFNLNSTKGLNFIHNEFCSNCLLNHLFIPENFSKEAWQFQLKTEFNNYSSLYSHEPWWQKIAERYELMFDKNKMFNQPIFFLDSNADVEAFIEKANSILNPHYQIEMLQMNNN